MANSSATVSIDTKRVLGQIDERIYSGFTEHMGRCIYGGIVDPGNDLSDPVTGYRLDVLEALKELRPPLVRYPGGNFVSSYRWQDGIGPKETRPKRLELAWRGEESNQFGTDDMSRYFMSWCKELGAEPFICLNMGTGTLESALDWLEYMNGSSNTHWAAERRKNGHDEPYKVKYIALGNEMWGDWQVGQQSAEDYAKAARQWGKALKLVDPTIKLISCGKEGYDDWDRIVLAEVVDIVDFHSLHLYTKGATHEINVMGPAAAEKAINMTMEVVDLARIAKKTANRPTICFDEWNVWDPVIADGEKGAEQVYTMSDAVAVASWLNVFVRTAKSTSIACLAQSVNVISPLMTSPSGILKQTTFFPIQLFANHMRGMALDLHVDSPRYEGPTDLPWVRSICAEQLTWLDASASLDVDPSVLNLVLVNRHGSLDFDVQLRLTSAEQVSGDVEVFEVHHGDVGAINSWETQPVGIAKSIEKWTGSTKVKAHSLRLLRIPLK